MSLYSDPAFFREARRDLQAQPDVPEDIQDLETAFRDVMNIENYSELEMLRKRPDPKNKVEQQQLAMS